MTEDLWVAFGSEGELEDFLRDPAAAPLRGRTIRLPSLAPGEAVFSNLSPEESRAVREVARRYGAVAGVQDASPMEEDGCAEND